MGRIGFRIFLGIVIVFIFGSSPICIAQPAQIKKCENDLRLETDLRGNFGALRNQGKKGWCYAYASADLIGEHLLVNKIGPDPRAGGNEVSATSVALNYNEGFRNESLSRLRMEFNAGNVKDGYQLEPLLTTEAEAGLVNLATEKALRSPICRASEVADDHQDQARIKDVDVLGNAGT